MGYFSKALDILPTALFSRVFGAVADINLPSPVQRCVNHSFAKLAGLNMEETELPLNDYPSLSALFTRQLKSDARTISSDDVISPVDGHLSFMGEVSDGTLLEAKGHEYSVSRLVGSDSDELIGWLNQAFAFTVYLSPSNYHRIHAPISGNITHMSYVPGRLLPVNRLGYILTDDLLPANERLTSFIDRADGHRCALVKVGATCVGKISVTYDEFASNAGFFRSPFERALETHPEVKAGNQIACFDLGSTIVLFVDRENFVPNPNLHLGMPIKMGQSLGNWR